MAEGGIAFLNSSDRDFAPSVRSYVKRSLGFSRCCHTSNSDKGLIKRAVMAVFGRSASVVEVVESGESKARPHWRKWHVRSGSRDTLNPKCHPPGS